MKKQIPVRVNQVLKLAVNKFGKEGDPVFLYKNFVIFLKKQDKITVRINEFIKIRVTKVLSKFAIAELVIE